MKKLFVCFLAATSLIACKTEEKKTETAEKTATVEHMYKPTYTDNFKIGGEGNMAIAENFHKSMFAKDFKTLASFIADTAKFWMEDGSKINGKDSMMQFIEANFSKINILEMAYP